MFVICFCLLLSFLSQSECTYKWQHHSRTPLYSNYLGRLNPYHIQKETPMYSTKMKDYDCDTGSMSIIGTLGYVHKCVERSTHRVVAIKVFHDKHKRIFHYNDIGVLFKIPSHPNIIKLIGVTDHQIKPYVSPDLIFEWVAHGDLTSYTRSRLWTKSKEGFLKEVRSIMKQIFTGVEFLARHKIIHRDLKLENVLMDKGQVKIADFGGSIDMENRGFEKDEMYHGVTAYINECPEMLEYHPYSYSSDIWSCGIMFLQILGVSLPGSTAPKDAVSKFYINNFYHVHSVSDISQSNALKAAYRKVEDLNAIDLIIRCLQYNPNARITAAEALEHVYIKDS